MHDKPTRFTKSDLEVAGIGMRELIDIVHGDLCLGPALKVTPGRNVTAGRHVMTCWRLVELRLPGGGRSRYLAGLVDGQARVCPDVVRLDIDRLQALVPSGLVYTLQGAPRYDFDADFLLNYWMRLKQVSLGKDLTRAVLRLKSWRERGAAHGEAGVAGNAIHRRPVQARLF